MQYSEEIPALNDTIASTAFIIGWRPFWTPPTIADTGTISHASISESNVYFGAFITK